MEVSFDAQKLVGEVNDLVKALYDDAVKPGKEGISVDDLSRSFPRSATILQGESNDQVIAQVVRL